MGTSGKKDSQLVTRRVLNDFTDDALTISAVILFQKGTARLLKAHWRRKSRSVFLPQIEWLSKNFTFLFCSLNQLLMHSCFPSTCDYLSIETMYIV